MQDCAVKLIKVKVKYDTMEKSVTRRNKTQPPIPPVAIKKTTVKCQSSLTNKSAT